MQIRLRGRMRACIAAVLAAGLVAACSSTPAATLAPGGGGGGGGGGASSAPLVTIPPIPSVAVGGGGGGGAAGADVEAVAKALVPPNSTEVTKTIAQDTSFIVYSSTDSVDALKAFYEAAIPRAGLQIISTTTIQGGISWLVAKDASGSFGGAISVIPSGDGKTAVQVTVGKS